MVEKFNNSFKNELTSGKVLYASQMQNIVDKINAIIDNLPDEDDGGTPDPNNPGNNPTPTTEAYVQWLTEEEFEAKRNAGLLKNNILYIVVDSSGKILFMYLNGKTLNYTEPSHSGELPSEKITLSQWNSLTFEEKKSKVWIIVGDDGQTIIGIGTGGILTRIPVPASGIVERLTQALYDALGSSIVETTLYFIENTDGVIIKAYLGSHQLELGSNVEGIVSSLMTSMWSLGLTWNLEHTLILGIKGSMIDVSVPGQLYASTFFRDAVTGAVRDAGFMTASDLEGETFARIYANSTFGDIAKVAEVIAKITKTGTSLIEINADDIVFGSDTVNFNAAVISALESEIITKGLHLTRQGESSSVDISTNGILIHPDQNHTSVSLNNDGSGFLANGNVTWQPDGAVSVKGNIEATQFKVMDGTLPSIVFTTMSDTYRGPGYENLNASEILNGEPIGLVYSNGVPKYFFDFAPVKAENFSAEDKVFYSIVGASSSGKVNVLIRDVYFYVTSQGDNNYHKYIKTPRSNGVVINSDTELLKDPLYERGTTCTAFVDRSPYGHYMCSMTLYKEVKFVNGEKLYTGNAFLLDQPITGKNITSYIPNTSKSTIYRNRIYVLGDSNPIGASYLYSDSYDVFTLRQAYNNDGFDFSDVVVGIVESINNITNITDRNLFNRQS